MVQYCSSARVQREIGLAVIKDDLEGEIDVKINTWVDQDFTFSFVGNVFMQ
jgi:hypothetical protein